MRASQNILFMLLLGSLTFSACDNLIRFSSEKYSCEPRRIPLYEVSIGNLSQGKSAIIQLSSRQITGEIISLSEEKIMISADGMEITTNRLTGTVRIKAGNNYEKIDCVVDNFRM
ncbi:hypothetical protein OAM34_01525 [Alphaproteobacteria bacterium]|nr:hypothetical protein [Alphaproteobacteria bacterium]